MTQYFVFSNDLNIFAACGSMFANSMCKLGKKSVNKTKKTLNVDNQLYLLMYIICDIVTSKFSVNFFSHLWVFSVTAQSSSQPQN